MKVTALVFLFLAPALVMTSCTNSHTRTDAIQGYRSRIVPLEERLYAMDLSMKIVNQTVDNTTELTPAYKRWSNQLQMMKRATLVLYANLRGSYRIMYELDLDDNANIREAILMRRPVRTTPEIWIRQFETTIPRLERRVNALEATLPKVVTSLWKSGQLQLPLPPEFNSYLTDS